MGCSIGRLSWVCFTANMNLNMEMILWTHGNMWEVSLCGMGMRVFWIMVAILDSIDDVIFTK